MKESIIKKTTLIRIFFCILILVLLMFYNSNLNLKSKSSQLEATINGINLNLNLMKNFLTESKETIRQLNKTLNNILKLLEVDNTYLKNKTIQYANKIEYQDQYLIPNVKIFDLNKPLEPKFLYSSIKCRTSANLHNVNTTLCIHDISRDIYVR